MQRKAVAGLAIVVVLAGFAAYWFGLRGRPGHKPKAAVATEADPWAKPRTDAPKPAPDQAGNQGPTGAMPRLAFETDPVGTFVLEGQVLDEHDEAVAGAVVRISSSPARTVTTNATGEFRFDKLLGRTYSLTAHHADKVGGPVSAKGSSHDPVVIRLRQATILEVAVTDARSKKPVAGAKVMLVDDDEAEGLTGPDGVARFPVNAGWSRVAVTAAGFSPGNGVSRIGKGEKTAHLDIALIHGAAVSGRVVDEQRQPVADARVWPVDAANAWMSGGGDRLAVTSAKDGTFTIPALAAGSWILFAKDETHAPASTKPITVNGEVTTTGVEIVMPTAAAIAGQVVDGQGAPVAYATVQLSSDRWSIDMVYRQAAADEQGHFSITALPRRSFKLRATSDEASSDAVKVDLTGVAEKKDVKLVLDHTGTIAGVVVDSDGEGVAEAEVSAGPDFLSGDRGDDDMMLAGGDTATTDGDGRFVLHGLEDGSYRLFAVRDAGGVRRVGERAGVVAKVGATDVRLVLPSPGGIKGKVVLEAGGAPASATITAGWENRTTTKDGNFHLTEVPPATYDVRVSGAEFSEVVKRDIVVVAGKEVDLGTITVRPGRKVAGKVVDGKGAPVEGAKVMMGQLLFGDGKRVGGGAGNDDEDQPGVRSTRTNARGEFVLIGASRSGGSLLADHADLGRSIAIVIPPGKDDVRGVEVSLLGYGSVAGKVTRKGEPVAGAMVSAAPTGASGQAVFVTAGADGAFVFDKLPAGPTTLLALNMGMMKASSGGRDVVVVEGEQAEGSVAIPVGDISLTVHVKGKDGAQVGGAQVFLFHGTVRANTGLDVSNAFLARRGVAAEVGELTVAVGTAAGMTFWLGTGDPKFEEIEAGPYTLCAIPFGDITDQQVLQRVMRNLDKITAVCMPLTITPAPKNPETTFEIPAMAPLPEDAE